MEIPIEYINLMHIFIIAPLLYYIGNNKQNSNDKSFNILAILALLVITTQIEFPPKFELKYWNIIHIFHWFVVFPFMLYIGYTKKVPLELYDVLKYTSIGIALYHSYRFYIHRFVHPEDH